MSDEELRALFSEMRAETRQYFAETRRHVDNSAAETRRHVDDSVQSVRRELADAVAELRQRIDDSAAETRRYVDERVEHGIAEYARMLGVTADQLRYEIQLVAEGVLAVREALEREAADIRAELRTSIAETRAMIRFAQQ